MGSGAIVAKSVLVVEDEPHIVDSLSFLMKRAGFTVFVARDGESRSLAGRSATRPKPRTAARGRCPLRQPVEPRDPEGTEMFQSDLQRHGSRAPETSSDD